MRHKPKKANLPRIILQWGFIAVVALLAVLPFAKDDYTPDFEAYCPFGGLQALSSFLLNGSLACTMTSVQIAMGVLLMIGVFLFSKLFCAYLCPVGTVSEWLGKVGGKLRIRLTPEGFADKALRALKYLLLFITFYYTLTSSELFCKKYDPYFAASTGFGADVVLLYASLALALVVAGSVLIRLFWCKYLCPLGALSNLFKFAWFFLAVVGGFAVLRLSGVGVSFVWPLAIACTGGFVLENWGEKLLFLPVARITRNETTCTDCRICSRKCPQAIDVASLRVVNHLDCNLCSDCIMVCPVQDTIQINKRKSLKWLPPVATVVLIILGVGLGKLWEVPTINQQWGQAGLPDSVRIYTRSGLKTVKCFGSSMAFANQMREVKGVLGVATYVGTHTVKITYDPALTNERTLQAEMFVPAKRQIQSLADGTANIRVIDLSLDNFFDPMDFTNLGLLLQEKSRAVGMESEFDCPVRIRIYFPGNETPGEQALKQVLETRSIRVTSDGKTSNVETDFQVAGKMVFSQITRNAYLQRMFSSYTRAFNNRNRYRESRLDTLRVPLGSNPYDTDALPYLVGHLSNDNGVVGFRSASDSLQRIEFQVIYVDSMTTPAKILRAMQADSLSFVYDDGEAGKIPNRFKFETVLN